MLTWAKRCIRTNAHVGQSRCHLWKVANEKPAGGTLKYSKEVGSARQPLSLSNDITISIANKREIL
ncbi:hypothetical protein AMTR_s00092p00153420 [Amborella trichopoda]|uniref:Uncharacterized protein n=1 Tax=Amborella trichopoda TaxID=13333 RepID=W1NVC4_AMBTC|nr:hypothetical protein AMTR_s00092p00153420 [Amborella trichopoda]